MMRKALFSVFSTLTFGVGEAVGLAVGLDVGEDDGRKDGASDEMPQY